MSMDAERDFEDSQDVAHGFEWVWMLTRAMIKLWRKAESAAWGEYKCETDLDLSCSNGSRENQVYSHNARRIFVRTFRPCGAVASASHFYLCNGKIQSSTLCKGLVLFAPSPNLTDHSRSTSSFVLDSKHARSFLSNTNMASSSTSSSIPVKRSRTFHPKAQNVHILASPARQSLPESLVPVRESSHPEQRVEPKSSHVDKLAESNAAELSESRRLEEEADIPRRLHHERTIKGWETRRMHEAKMKERLSSGPLGNSLSLLRLSSPSRCAP